MKSVMGMENALVSVDTISVTCPTVVPAASVCDPPVMRLTVAVGSSGMVVDGTTLTLPLLLATAASTYALLVSWTSCVGSTAHVGGVEKFAKFA
jgi:hypothetical protein